MFVEQLDQLCGRSCLDPAVGCLTGVEVGVKPQLQLVVPLRIIARNEPGELTDSSPKIFAERPGPPAREELQQTAVVPQLFARGLLREALP